MIEQRQVCNLLVTGGAGFIGSNFIRYLLSEEANFQGTCVNYDALTYAGNLENLNGVDHDPRYSFMKGDIGDEELVEKICRERSIDTIIHFAAESHVDRSILGPRAFIETNILGTYHLLEVVKRLPSIHFHHVSTDEVYGSLESTGHFTEETAYHPNSPYSASKASSDHLVRAYANTFSISTCISNCSNNYGPYQFPEKLIPLMILNCLERKPLPVYGQGLNVRDWLYVKDHSIALSQLLTYGRKGETYNIGGECEWTNLDVVYQIVKSIAQKQNVSVQSLEALITFVKDRPGHDLRYAIDCSKIKKEIGWKPSHTFEDGLDETIRWYMENSPWIEHVRTGAYRQWMADNYAQR
jgi:dTDP-glucose 4,6-dehydratase